MRWCSRRLGIPTIDGGDVPVANEEPLARELADFVDAVAAKRATARHRRSRAAARLRWPSRSPIQ